MVAFSSPISDFIAKISLSFSNEDLTTNENKLSPSISGMITSFMISMDPLDGLI